MLFIVDTSSFEGSTSAGANTVSAYQVPSTVRLVTPGLKRTGMSPCG
jgi:hypothetical protein